MSLTRIVALSLIVIPLQATMGQEAPPQSIGKQAKTEPSFVSRTFQGIQNRVVHRDSETKAIQSVRTALDAPAKGVLHFQIVPVADDQLVVRRGVLGEMQGLEEIPHDGEAVITLSAGYNPGGRIYEQYRLRLDDALRQELENQTRFRQLRIDRHKEAVRLAKAEITRLSGGTLRYGMSTDEVKQVLGQPIRFEIHMKIERDTFYYDDFVLDFDPHLFHIRQADKAK